MALERSDSDRILDIALVQMDVEPNRPDLNFEKFAEITHRLKTEGPPPHIIAGNEMIFSGYMIGDYWERRAFLQNLVRYNEQAAALSDDLTTIMFGGVAIDTSINPQTGKTRTNFDGTTRKYNAAYVAQNGAILPNLTTYKTHLPTYRQFRDARHFTSTKQWAAEEGLLLEEAIRMHDLTVRGTRLKVGLMLCEDMWWEDYGENIAEMLRDDYIVLLQAKAWELLRARRQGNEAHAALKQCRSKRELVNVLAVHGVDREEAEAALENAILMNFSCSPWGLRKANKRHRIVKTLFKDGNGMPMFYVNNVGYQNIGKTHFVFDGRSCVYDSKGNPVQEAEEFEETIMRVAFDPSKEPEKVGTIEELPDMIELKKAMVYAIIQYMETTGMKDIVLGDSGGADSHLSKGLFVEALGAEHVWAVNMPSNFNSKTTKDISRQSSVNFGVNYAVAPIQQSLERIAEQIEEIVFTRPDGTTTPIRLGGSETDDPAVRKEREKLNRENIQARIRGSEILSALSPILKAIIPNNGNKDETAYGYATLNGDIIGAIALLGDLYKGQIYGLLYTINKERAAAGLPGYPMELFSVPPSAELSDDQDVDEGKGDPFWYPYLDLLTMKFVENLDEPELILQKYADGTLGDDLQKLYDRTLSYVEGHGEYLQAYNKDRPVTKGILDLDDYFATNGMKPGTRRSEAETTAEFIADLEKRWKGLHLMVYKRNVGQPVFKASSRAFGFDYEEPQTDAFFPEEYYELKAKILSGEIPLTRSSGKADPLPNPPDRNAEAS